MYYQGQKSKMPNKKQHEPTLTHYHAAWRLVKKSVSRCRTWKMTQHLGATSRFPELWKLLRHWRRFQPTGLPSPWRT